MAGPALTRGDLVTAVTHARASLLRLREALRVAAEEATGNSRPTIPISEMSIGEATHVINCTASKAPGQVMLVWGSGKPVKDIRWDGIPVQILLSAIAMSGIELLTEPSVQLRACQGPKCALFFTQGHRRREWCSSSCGNRARVARHYARQHSTERAVATDNI